MFPLVTWRDIQLSIQASKNSNKYNILDTQMLGNFRRISYKDKRAFETTRMAVRKFSGKRHSSCYPCMNKTFNNELW